MNIFIKLLTAFLIGNLLYGINYVELLFLPEKKKKYFFVTIIKNLCILSSSIALTWIVTRFFFAPLGITNLFPLIQVLLMMPLFVFFSLLFERSSKIELKDFAFLFLNTLLALLQNSTLLSALVFGIVLVLGFYFLFFIFAAFNYRNGFYGITNSVQKIALKLFGLTLFMTIITLCNLSWLLH